MYLAKRCQEECQHLTYACVSINSSFVWSSSWLVLVPWWDGAGWFVCPGNAPHLPGTVPHGTVPQSSACTSSLCYLVWGWTCGCVNNSNISK